MPSQSEQTAYMAAINSCPFEPKKPPQPFGVMWQEAVTFSPTAMQSTVPLSSVLSRRFTYQHSLSQLRTTACDSQHLHDANLTKAKEIGQPDLHLSKSEETTACKSTGNNGTESRDALARRGVA